MPSAAIHHAAASDDYERAGGPGRVGLAHMEWELSVHRLASWVEELPKNWSVPGRCQRFEFAWAYLNAGKLEAAQAEDDGCRGG